MPVHAPGYANHVPKSNHKACALPRGAREYEQQLQGKQMIGTVTIRRLRADHAQACVDGLADVLIDCVEGGASVSFMLPIGREKAIAFWRAVADDVQQAGRILLVAEDNAGQIVGTVQVITAQPENQRSEEHTSELQSH